jgi:hypothetical protein
MSARCGLPTRLSPARPGADLAGCSPDLGETTYRGDRTNRRGIADQFFGRVGEIRVSDPVPAASDPTRLPAQVEPVNEKLGMRDRLDLTRFAIRAGLVEP